MATSALSELPPPPPPTSDALDIYSTPPSTPHKELDDSSNKCLLPFIDSSTSRGEAQPASVGNDFLPTDLLFALKRQDKPVTQQHRGATPPREPQSTGVHGIKAPAKMWGYSSRRGRLKHLTKAPPCICGAGRDISFLYDSPPSERRKVPKKVSSCILVTGRK